MQPVRLQKTQCCEFWEQVHLYGRIASFRHAIPRTASSRYRKIFQTASFRYNPAIRTAFSKAWRTYQQSYPQFYPQIHRNSNLKCTQNSQFVPKTRNQRIQSSQFMYLELAVSPRTRSRNGGNKGLTTVSGDPLSIVLSFCFPNKVLLYN